MNRKSLARPTREAGAGIPGTAAPAGPGWQNLLAAAGLALAGCAAPSAGLRATDAGQATAAEMPQMAHSNESTEKQLDLARKQGYATELALKWLLGQAAPAAAQQPAGEYQVAYLLSAPEGCYAPASAAWQGPAAGATAHLRVFVRDGADGRIVPGLTVRAEFTDAAGHALAAQELPYGWYPLLAGYGDNVALPPGTYRLRLTVSAMPFRRHDPYNGDRLSRPVEAAFAAVAVPAALARQAPLSAAEERETTLAAAQGDAYHQTTLAMYAQANDGKDKPLGEYHVGYAIEYAEAYWHFPEDGHGGQTARANQPPGKLRYASRVEGSGEHNAHVEVAVLEERTGRFLPGLHVVGTVTDAQGHALGTQDIPFMWHPWLYHYGENWRVTGNGTYRLHVRAEAPPYRRYGRETGRALASALDTDFDDVKMLAGQK